MAYTNEVIAFAAVNGNILLDAIPLSEVISIDLMKDLDPSDEQHHLHNSYELQSILHTRSKFGRRRMARMQDANMCCEQNRMTKQQCWSVNSTNFSE